MSFLIISPYSTNLVYYNAVWSGFNSSANILKIAHSIKVAKDNDAQTLINLLGANVGLSAANPPTAFTTTIQDATSYNDVFAEAMYDTGVPLVTSGGGSTISPGLGIPTHVGMDDYTSGYEAALKMAGLGSHYGMCIQHSSSASAQARCAGWFAGYQAFYGSGVQFTTAFNSSNPQSNPYCLLVSASKVTASSDLSTKLTTTRTDVDAIIISSGQLMDVVIAALATVKTATPSRVIRFATYDFTTASAARVASLDVTFAVHQQEVFLGFLAVAYMYTLAAVNETAIVGAALTGPIFVESSNVAFFTDTLNNLGTILAAPQTHRLAVILHGNDRDSEMPIVLRGIQDAANAWGYAIQEEYHTFSATTSFVLATFNDYLTQVFAGCGSSPTANKPCPQGVIISRANDAFVAAAKTKADQYSVALAVIGIQKDADHTALNDVNNLVFEVGASDYELGWTAAQYLYNSTGSLSPLCFYHDGFVSGYMDRCLGMTDYYSSQGIILGGPSTFVFVDAEYASNAYTALASAILSNANVDGILLASSATVNSYRAWLQKNSHAGGLPTPSSIKAKAVVALGKSADVVAALNAGEISRAFMTQPYATGFYATYHLAIKMNTAITGLKNWYLKTGPLERAYGCPRGYALIPDNPLYGVQPNSSFASFGSLCQPCPQHTYNRFDDDPQGCIPCGVGFYNNITGGYGCGSGDDGFGKLAYPAQCPTTAEIKITKYTATSKALAGLGIAGAAISASMCVALIVFRDSARIKSSGAYFSALITLGSALGCLSVLTFAAAPTTATCTATVWLLALAVTMVLSNLIVKNYRIFKIFFNRRAAKAAQGSWKLVVQAIGLTAVTVVILIAWTIASPPSPYLVQTGARNYYVCLSPSPNHEIFLGLLFGWNGILILAGLAVAYLTRNISSVFAESRNIALGIYNILITSVIALGAGFLAGDAVDFNFKLLLVSICIIIGSLVAPGLLFGKRIWDTVVAKATDKMDEESGGSSGGQAQTILAGAAGAKRKSSIAGTAIEFEKATVIEIPDCSVLQSGFVAAWSRKNVFFVNAGKRQMVWFVDASIGGDSGTVSTDAAKSILIDLANYSAKADSATSTVTFTHKTKTNKRAADYSYTLQLEEQQFHKVSARYCGDGTSAADGSAGVRRSVLASRIAEDEDV
ncbi:hypothetical protein HDU90_003172 [Geranomyces variabilis]|nr:hypothetical protein HDU90_003172 [Geranomyces variabilis]